MHFELDRSLPIPVGVQLRGQIEYGIACGDIARGSRLPSVRELSSTLGVAPATVSQVYKELLQAGLIETLSGKGTYVTRATPRADARNQNILHRAVDDLLEYAQSLGYGASELTHLVQLRAHAYRVQPALEVAFVGIFPEATRAYVDALRTFLKPSDTFQVTTLQALEAHPEECTRLAHADLIVTLGHHEATVRRLLGSDKFLTSVSFIPSEATRTALAALDPKVRLGLVATFPAFLPTMKRGVVSYAPHIYELRASTLDGPELPQLLAWSEAVVYATGSEALLPALPVGVTAFEYRHTPEPRSVEMNLLPLIEQARHEKRWHHEHSRDELAPG